MRWYRSSLLKQLAASNGERHIHAFLKRHPRLVVSAFNWGWNHVFLVPEFQLGTQLRADFVLFGGYSTGWNVRFIELEPVGARLYLKDGTPSKELRTAIRQISDWREYVRVHEADLRDALSRSMVAQNVFCPRYNNVSRFLEKHLRDPREMIHWYAHIVIGRRAGLSEEDQRRRSRGSDYVDAEIATYDRLVETAETLDNQTRDLIAWRRKQSSRTTPR